MLPNWLTVIGVDRAHLEQLRIVWPTWQRFRPELFERPMLFVADAHGWLTTVEAYRAIRCVVGPFSDFSICHTRSNGLPQRWRMLDAIVQHCGHSRSMPYFLKLDTDAIATGPGLWVLPEWFEGDPAIIASPWGYTRPKQTIAAMDDWAALKDWPQPPLAPRCRMGDTKAMYPRITGWCMWGRSDFGRQCVDLLNGLPIPVPSQDTYHWYCAERLGLPIRKVRMSHYGWQHVLRTETLQRIANEVLT